MDEQPKEDHDPDTCPGCEARRREGEIADQLSLEITQAINRAISKSDLGLDMAVLTAPLALNLALLLLKYEHEGNSYEEGVARVVDLIDLYRNKIFTQGGDVPPGNA